MKQVFISIFLIVLMSMVGARAYAYDIAVENSDGVTICYNYINDGKDLEVTQTGSFFSNGGYRGTVVIPKEVTYMNRTRKVTSIGRSAFYYCVDLTSVTIPNSVTSIGDRAFYECLSLASFTIPNSVTSIGDRAFYECTGLTSVHISDIETWCKITFSGENSNPLQFAHHLYVNGEEIKDLVIPNSVTRIGNYAFYGCVGLTSVTIPNSVTSIGYYAFPFCHGLTTVTIPNSVTSIGDRAFYGCHGLASVTIPNSVTSIGDFVFIDCTCLTSVTIPNSVTSIGEGAFLGSGLTSVTIPNSVTSIGRGAFRNCKSLTSVIIPNSVTSIGNNAFDGCNIPVVVSFIENPFAINGKDSDNRTFNQNTFNNATLYVPVGTIDKYKATYGWIEFDTIVEGVPSGLKGMLLDCEKNYPIYDISGRKLDTPKKGINIINGKKVMMK